MSSKRKREERIFESFYLAKDVEKIEQRNLIVVRRTYVSLVQKTKDFLSSEYIS